MPASRTNASIEANLSGKLLDAYKEQLEQVREFLRQKGQGQGEKHARVAMKQLFEQGYGLKSEAAGALAQLAVDMPAPRDSMPKLLAISERLALQRALVQAGVGKEVRPFLLAASQGALAGQSITDEQILNFEDPEQTGRWQPSIPPLHDQDRDISKAASSEMFEKGMEGQ